MENSKIEWCHHTYNPWWGCVKVSPGCEHCYAETLSNRFGQNIWGPAKTTSRRTFGDKHWNEPLKWNEAAKKAGERHRVFCASMADVFEDHPQLVAERRRLVVLMEKTPHLIWLLLTKRPENILPMLQQQISYPVADWFKEMGDRVWVGTSVEDQQRADQRIPHLLQVLARVRFLSCEPLLGPVNIKKYLAPRLEYFTPITAYGEAHEYSWDRLHWVICGGESGPHARPMHPDWARSLRDQCQAAGTAVFFKQWGEFAPCICDDPGTGCARVWPDGRHTPVDGWEPGPEMIGSSGMHRVGKKRAGRLLDGVEWNQFPEARETVQG